MSEITNNFTWTRQLECPPTVYNDSMKKILCKGVLELLWEDISNSAFSVAEACKIRKNILLYKLKHGLNDSTIASIKHLNQLRSKSNALKQQISTLEEEYEEQDHIVRQKMQRLKDIKDKCSIISTRKDFLKLKHDETSKQLKDCGDMRRVCQHLMPNISKDIDQQKLRKNLDTIAGLRSTANKKQVWEKISSSLGNIDIHTLWTHLYQALSQDLDKLMKLETKNDSSSSTVASENIDIGIARACGQNICMISKRILSNAKIKTYQQRLIEFIESIESLSCNEDISTWLALTLEVKKLETEQAYLQNEVQKLKNNIQDNSLLNHDIARLTTDIETVDAQMDGYVKDIQQSIAIFNSTTSLILKAKEKLHYGLQKIAALQSDDYDPNCLNNALDIELDMFYNNLDLNALRKVMLKGDVGLYRHTICNLSKTSITTISPQCWRIKAYFPMIQMPIYCLIECYRNAIANIIYTKLHCSTSIKDIDQCTDRLVSREKCDYNSLELLSLAKVVCDQAREEIEHFDAVLKAWMCQEVQEAMALVETTVDNVSFKDWLQRYSLLLYMIQNDHSLMRLAAHAHNSPSAYPTSASHLQQNNFKFSAEWEKEFAGLSTIDTIGDSGYAESNLTDTYSRSSSGSSVGYDSSIKVAPGSDVQTTYSWRETGYTSCSATCLGGVQDLIINCVRDDTGKTVMPLLCTAETKPEARIRACNDHPCPPRWNYSEFSTCMSPCGIGIQTRDVTCIHEVTHGTGKAVPVPNYMCPQPPPADRRYCNVWDCPIKWSTGEWGKCSRTCGGGVKKRDVVCEQIMAQGRKQSREERECPAQKPPSEKPCNTRACHDSDLSVLPIITSLNTTYNQTDINAKVDLRIGGIAKIFQGTPIKIRCPVRKFDKAQIVWRKDNKEIRKSRMSRCWIRASATKPRGRYKDRNDACKGVWRVGEWTECTASCEEDGTKYRILQCVWFGTKKPAGNACRDILRPPVMKTCRGPPCPQSPEDCKDHSQLCSRVKIMNMCKVPLYKKQCCASCR